MKYKKFVAHCSVFCRFCPFTPTHASVSWETPGLSLDKCVSACLCLCHFSHYVCVCVSVLLLAWAQQSSEAYCVLVHVYLTRRINTLECWWTQNNNYSYGGTLAVFMLSHRVIRLAGWAAWTEKLAVEHLFLPTVRECMCLIGKICWFSGNLVYDIGGI